MLFDTDLVNIEAEAVKVFDDPSIFTIYSFSMEIKWYFNLIFVALPWGLLSWLMAWYNIIINAWINKGWAEGNVWLILNTIFCLL